MKRLTIFLTFSFIYGGLITPEDGATLNHIHVLFEWEQIPEADHYQIQMIIPWPILKRRLLTGTAPTTGRRGPFILQEFRVHGQTHFHLPLDLPFHQRRLHSSMNLKVNLE